MKTLILWLWAFWFAVAKHLWENNKDTDFYAYELNNEIFDSIKNGRKHPFFFDWYSLPENIVFTDNYKEILKEIDLLILAIPTQFINSTIWELKNELKPWVTILNLAKWIDLNNDLSISELLSKQMWDKDYNYAVLSWWMIASEFVEWKILWADIAIENSEIWNQLKKMFQSENLTIKIRKNVVNVELYGSLKNILAIITGYYEAKWYKQSSIWLIISDFLVEMQGIIVLYWGNQVLDFSYYSLWSDIIATCFWDSRNRYLGKLLWSGKNIEQAIEILINENKMAEWYKTLLVVHDKVKDLEWYDMIKFIHKKII